jgi:predicted DNA-binding transcriptional regulator YafY
MRRADRLFQIVGQLRHRRFMTAAELGECFGVSARTIYRDILDLCASGVPILGEAGVGYHLDPSYRLPPLMFSTDEVEALVIGMRMVESWGDEALQRSARSIVHKVNAVVPQRERERLNATSLFSLSFSRGRMAAKNLGPLREAVNERKPIEFAYEDGQGAVSRRSAKPLGLYFWGQVWTLAAWCDLREDFRNFRTDRISELVLSSDRFEAVSPWTLADYVERERARGNVE